MSLTFTPGIDFAYAVDSEYLDTLSNIGGEACYVEICNNGYLNENALATAQAISDYDGLELGLYAFLYSEAYNGVSCYDQGQGFARIITLNEVPSSNLVFAIDIEDGSFGPDESYDWQTCETMIQDFVNGVLDYLGGTYTFMLYSNLSFFNSNQLGNSSYLTQFPVWVADSYGYSLNNIPDTQEIYAIPAPTGWDMWIGWQCGQDQSSSNPPDTDMFVMEYVYHNNSYTYSPTGQAPEGIFSSELTKKAKLSEKAKKILENKPKKFNSTK